MNTMNYEEFEELLDELADMSAAQIRDSVEQEMDGVQIIHRKSPHGLGHTAPYRRSKQANVWKRTT